ncbi:MAG: hypothetical protein IKX84_10070 [Clostridia bacterium]|nr:hypothetical protein [Clostridia bacterium]
MKKRLDPRIKAVIGALAALAVLWGGKELARLLISRWFGDGADTASMPFLIRQAYLYYESLTSVMAYMAALTVCLFMLDWVGRDSRKTNKRLYVLLPAGIMLGAGVVALLIDLDVIRRETATVEAGAYLSLALIPLRCFVRELVCRSVLQRGLAAKHRCIALTAGALASALMYALIPGRLSVIGVINGLLLGVAGGLVYEKTASVLPMALLGTGFGLGVSLDGFVYQSALYKVGDELFSGGLSLIYDGLGLTLALTALLTLIIISGRTKAKTRK